MTEAEKDAAMLMLNEGEAAAFRVIDRVSCDTGISQKFVPSAIGEGFEEMRRRIRIVPLTEAE